MRRYWFAAIALIAGLVTGLAPAYAGTGGGVAGSGCSFKCGDPGDGSGFCLDSVAGEMATCKNIQQCYNLYGGWVACDPPSCQGTYCMFI
jgi:hypothetical protein